MGTNAKDVEEARRALAEADAGRRAVRTTRPAPWSIPSVAALVAALALGQLLPVGASIALSLVAALAIGAIVGLNARATGVQTSFRHGGDAKAGALAALGMVVLFGAAALVGEPAGWVACAVMAAAVVVVLGRAVERR